MKVTVDDFRRAGICKKAKTLFFCKHNLDWKSFIRDGIDSEVLRSFGEHLEKIDALEAAARSRLVGPR